MYIDKEMRFSHNLCEKAHPPSRHLRSWGLPGVTASCCFQDCVDAPSASGTPGRPSSTAGRARCLITRLIPTFVVARARPSPTSNRPSPSPESDLAKGLLNDPYAFEFLNVSSQMTERGLVRGMRSFRDGIDRDIVEGRPRFPGDFAFRLTAGEKAEMVANCDHLSRLRYSKALPYAFTEHGAIMAASILNSHTAVEVSVFVVRAFVKLRRSLASRGALTRRIAELEKRLSHHDRQIASIVQAIKQLISTEPVPPKQR